MINKLRELNEKMLIRYDNDEKNLRKYQIIKEILNDDKCFFNIPIEYAYSILRDLEIEESKIKDVYKELIDSKNF